MTGTYNLVVLANRAPHDAEVLTGPDTALRRAVRDLGGVWAGTHDPNPGGGPPIQAARLAAAVDRQSTDAIWPTYHDAVQTPTFLPDWQLTHRDLNNRLAQATAQLAAPAATVWVIGHDLQLAPAMLRACRPDARIGFYLPIPFPPVELFMRLPFRDDILRGLLGADAIGVQTAGDVDNLMRAARHLLGVPVDGGTLVLPNRRVTVSALPTSVDTADIAQHATSPATLARARDMRAQLGNPRLLILSVDPLDHAAGIEHRLHALEQLLTERRLRTGQTAVVQIALPPRHRTHADESLRHRVEHLIARINGDHGKVGHPAVHYLHRPISGPDLLALHLAADLLLATPLRDGMNLTAKHYLAARVDNTGALILSEFSGAAAELHAAHLVNPYDLDDLKATILYAATEPPNRATHRIRTLRQHLRQHDARSWAGKLLSTLDPPTPTSGHAPNSTVPARTPALRTGGGT